MIAKVRIAYYNDNMSVPQNIAVEFYKFQSSLKKEWVERNPFPLPMWSASAWFNLIEERKKEWLAHWRAKTADWFAIRGYAVAFIDMNSMAFAITQSQNIKTENDLNAFTNQARAERESGTISLLSISGVLIP